jgi:hypothetical protein
MQEKLENYLELLKSVLTTAWTVNEMEKRYSGNGLRIIFYI